MASPLAGTGTAVTVSDQMDPPASRQQAHASSSTHCWRVLLIIAVVDSADTALSSPEADGSPRLRLDGATTSDARVSAPPRRGP